MILKKKETLFIFILLMVYFFFNLETILFKFPQGVHFIRQTDSLAFASHYYHFGYNFFSPGTFNLMSSNAYAACEFPIIYYLTALIYLIIGEKDFVLRAINIMILSIGCFHLFRLSMILMKDFFLSILSILFLFSSVAFVYYGFNFLPDSAALGFTFSAWYFYFKFLKSKKKASIYTCFVFFIFASLLKATYFIQPIAVILLLFANYKNDLKYYFNKLIPLFITSGFIILSWNVYVYYFNTKFHSTYFTTSILPIWEMSQSGIIVLWNEMMGEWYKKYLAESSFHFYTVIALIGGCLGIIRYRKMLLLVLLLFCGSLSYLILFYQQFRYHDYYFLLMIPFVYFSLVLGLKGVLSLFKNRQVLLIGFKIIFLTIVISGIDYSRRKVNERYEKGKDNFSEIAFRFDENKTFIQSLHFERDDKLIVSPDRSVNGGLYLLKRKGWSLDVPDSLLITNIINLKGRGASHILLFDYERLSDRVSSDIGELISKNKDVALFKLY